ncbi:hypothetical protein LXL04_002556 [Taraxacum kok-saghyz]
MVDQIEVMMCQIVGTVCDIEEAVFDIAGAVFDSAVWHTAVWDTAVVDTAMVDIDTVVVFATTLEIPAGFDNAQDRMLGGIPLAAEGYLRSLQTVEKLPASGRLWRTPLAAFAAAFSRTILVASGKLGKETWRDGSTDLFRGIINMANKRHAFNKPFTKA